jgi:hypothetical protein
MAAVGEGTGGVAVGSAPTAEVWSKEGARWRSRSTVKSSIPNAWGEQHDDADDDQEPHQVEDPLPNH